MSKKNYKPENIFNIEHFVSQFQEFRNSFNFIIVRYRF